MSFVQAKCPNCGGVLAVDNSNEAAVCQFCNTPFIVEKAVNNYNITNTVNVGAGAVVNIIGNEKQDFEIIGGNLKKYVGASAEIIIPDSVVTIEDNVFKDFKNLKSVVISDSVKTIGKYAFSGCIGLENVTLGKSLEYIEEYAFDNCTEIKKVDFTGNIAEWCKIGFDNKYSNPVEHSGHLFINGRELTVITKEDLFDVTEISWRRFANCALKKVDS
ncbi:MAG: leucine-rich repeat domain-containing protein [Clostridia bacterium]|nr:leucine-rich repeat domain-containing protein [Clostridia bacterium]